MTLLVVGMSRDWHVLWFFFCFYRLLKNWKLVAQSCPTLCDPMDCSPPGFSVYGIVQARILQWVAIPLSTGSSQPSDWKWVSHIAGRFFTIWATREALWYSSSFPLYLLQLLVWRYPSVFASLSPTSPPPPVLPSLGLAHFQEAFL